MINPYPNDVFEYLPVEGCEECEFFEPACIECILYGEAKKVKDADEEDSND